MRKLVILGAGTAGTMMVNKLHAELDRSEWQITVVDQHESHYQNCSVFHRRFLPYTSIMVDWS